MVFRQLIPSLLGQVFGIVKETGTLMETNPAAATAAGVEELS